MKRNLLYAIIWKESKAIPKVSYLTGLLFGLFWVVVILVIYSHKKGEVASLFEMSKHVADSFIAYMPLAVMLFIGNSLLGQMFYEEKAKRTIEPLLCTPVNILMIWLGKVTTVFFLSYSLLLLIAGSYLAGHCIFIAPVFPSAPAFIQLFVVSPLLAFSIFGLVGYAYLLLVKPAIVNIANIIIMMAVVSIMFTTLQKLSVSWFSVGVLFVASLFLILLTGYGTRFLQSEKIIVSIA